MARKTFSPLHGFTCRGVRERGFIVTVVTFKLRPDEVFYQSCLILLLWSGWIQAKQSVRIHFDSPVKCQRAFGSSRGIQNQVSEQYDQTALLYSRFMTCHCAFAEIYKKTVFICKYDCFRLHPLQLQ